MALPGPKHKCHICSEEVTDADYRRELTCSYAACPGTNHAYHEECITEYLRKHKLSVARLIGYPCPVMLDNGRPCTGRITATHHKVPLNQKKKQKRVEAAAAAAAAAAAPKSKPQAAKPKEGKVAAADVAVAAMRPSGVTIGSVAAVMTKTAAPTGGGVPKTTGAVLAMSNCNAMAPERVVRQRQIPGWSGPDKVGKISTLEQQRAMVAALRAEAKTAAGHSGKFTTTTSAAPAALGVIAKELTVPTGAAVEERSASGNESTELDVQHKDDWLPDDNLDGNVTDKLVDFNLVQEDFPAYPTVAATKISTASGEKTPFDKLQSEGKSPSALTIDTKVSSVAGSSKSSPQHDDIAIVVPEPPTASPEDDDPNDPIVALDPLWVLPDGSFAVQDAYGNFFLVEDMYGPSVVTKDYMDETGTCRTYVVIRHSLVLAQIAQQARSNGNCVAATEECTPAAAPAKALSNISVLEAPVSLDDDVRNLKVIEACSHPSQEVPGAPAAFLVPQKNVTVEPEHADPGGELDDLLALCMGSPVPATAVVATGTENLSSCVQAQLHYAALGQESALCRGTELIAAAPAGYADMEQGDGEDMGSLLQLLCV